MVMVSQNLCIETLTNAYRTLQNARTLGVYDPWTRLRLLPSSAFAHPHRTFLSTSLCLRTELGKAEYKLLGSGTRTVIPSMRVLQGNEIFTTKGSLAHIPTMNALLPKPFRIGPTRYIAHRPSKVRIIMISISVPINNLRSFSHMDQNHHRM